MIKDLMVIGLGHYLAVAGALVVLGLYTVVARRNPVGVLLGVQLLLAGAGLELVAFDRFAQVREAAPQVEGQALTILVVVLAATQATVALAIVFRVTRSPRETG